MVKSVPSPDIFSPESANLNSFPDATSIADTSPSSLITSVAEPPSFTVNIKSLFDVALATVTSPLDAVIATPAFTVSDPTSNPAKDESVTASAVAAELDNTALNVSSPSFQYNTALLPAEPRCMNIPASTSAPPELFLFNSNNASWISMLVVLTDVVVPDTVKFPPTCKSPPISAVPVAEIFLNPNASLLESAITALLADTVPAVMPSTRLSSAAVDVIAVPLIASLPVTTLNVALSSTLATSVPSLCWNMISFASAIGLIMTSLDELTTLNICVPPALNWKSLPPASSIMSAAASTVKLFADMTRSVPSPSIFSDAPPNTIPTSFGI